MISVKPGKYKGHWGCYAENGHFALFVTNARPSQFVTIYEKPPTGKQILARLKVYLLTEFKMGEEISEVDARIQQKLSEIGTEKAVEEVLQHG